MATKTSVVMDTVDQAQKKSSRSITYIDPNASNSDIKNFIEGLNGLTHQTLADARRVDSTDLINDTKLPRNAYLTREDGTTDPVTSVKSSEIGTTLENALILNLHYDDQPGEFEEISIGKTGSSVEYYMTWMARTGDEQYNEGLFSILRGSQDLTAETIKIYIPEDSAYQAATITLTITAE